MPRAEQGKGHCSPLTEATWEVQQRFRLQGPGQGSWSQYSPLPWASVGVPNCCTAATSKVWFSLSDILWWYHFFSRTASRIALLLLPKMLFSSKLTAGVRMAFLTSGVRSPANSEQPIFINPTEYQQISNNPGYCGCEPVPSYGWRQHWDNLLSLLGRRLSPSQSKAGLPPSGRTWSGNLFRDMKGESPATFFSNRRTI